MLNDVQNSSWNPCFQNQNNTLTSNGYKDRRDDRPTFYCYYNVGQIA